MEHSVPREQYVGGLAVEVLDRFSHIAEMAKNRLGDKRTLGPESLASINTMNSAATIRSLDKISQTERETHLRLVAEPAIARVTVIDESGQVKTHYFCRADRKSVV